MAKLLILDEPTSALADAEIDQLMEILRGLKEHGVTCIYISHKIEEFFRITDTVTVLRDGKMVTTLGVLCGVVGVGLLVFSDQLETNGPVSHPYDLWIWAGLFIVMGFVFFVREWPERDDFHLHSG